MKHQLTKLIIEAAVLILIQQENRLFIILKIQNKND